MLILKPSTTPDQPTLTQRQEKIAELRQRLTARLTAEATPTLPTGRLPRYDDVYWDGVAWLESLTNE